MTDEQRSNQQRIDLDLDGLVARYGRMLAQSALDAELASQRAAKAEQAVRDLTARIQHLEDAAIDAPGPPDDD